ncbi:MAG: FHA domain-containing protein [Lachnospiraceae bacterium]|nr:FHA domain-containing protein [Lachnospiraceae bacterium]
MSSFSYENEGPNLYLVYRADASEKVSQENVQKLIEKKREGVVKTQYNTDEQGSYFKYNVNSLITLKQFLDQGIDEKMYCTILHSVASTLEQLIKEDIGIEHLILNEELIYYDYVKKVVNFISIPTDKYVNKITPGIIVYEFSKLIISRMGVTSNLILEVNNYLARGNYSSNEFNCLINSIIIMSNKSNIASRNSRKKSKSITIREYSEEEIDTIKKEELLSQITIQPQIEEEKENTNTNGLAQQMVVASGTDNINKTDSINNNLNDLNNNLDTSKDNLIDTKDNVAIDSDVSNTNSCSIDDIIRSLCCDNDMNEADNESVSNFNDFNMNNTINSVNVYNGTNASNINGMNICNETKANSVNGVNILNETNANSINGVNILNETNANNMNGVNILNETNANNMNRVNILKEDDANSVSIANIYNDNNANDSNNSNINGAQLVDRADNVNNIKEFADNAKKIIKEKVGGLSKDIAKVFGNIKNANNNPEVNNLNVTVPMGRETYQENIRQEVAQIKEDDKKRMEDIKKNFEENKIFNNQTNNEMGGLNTECNTVIIDCVTGDVVNGRDVSTSMPYLIRESTGEKIYINSNNFKLGRGRRFVDYYVGGNDTISKVHAYITSNAKEYFLVDNSSRNHTFLNGKVLEPVKQMILKHKAKIKLAKEEFTFYLY